MKTACALAGSLMLCSASLSVSAIDVEIAEVIPGVRLTMDVFTGGNDSWSFEDDNDALNAGYAKVRLGFAIPPGFASVEGEFVISELSDGGPSAFLGGESLYMSPSGHWPFGGEMIAGSSWNWGAGWRGGTGIFASAPSVFRLGAEYPGMNLAPTQLPMYPEMAAYGARFVFGAPYSTGNPVPDGGSLWWVCVVLLGGAGRIAAQHRSTS